jgi:class 3 adenylate cyclase
MKARDKSAGSQKAANLDGEVAELRRRLAAREAELAEALAQQTATAEILETINSSPGDLAPVFDAILEKAHTLCGADKGALAINESGGIRAVATRGLSEAFASLIRKPQGNTPGSPNARLLAGKNLLHIPDIRTVLGHIPQAAAELEGVRTILFIPLRKDRALLGYITAYRQEIRPFTDKQIALLQNFAAQAVIAMENARLLTETREALEQQIATAEVLGVINSSPGDLAPVFDAILEKAHSLCGIDAGSLQLYASGHFHAPAIRGMPETFAQVQRRPYQPPPGSPAARLVAGERIVHVADISETVKEWAGDPRAQAVIEQGLRTVLFVPLRKDTELLGYISAFRKEIRPFTEKQIALLQNFAAQAVIAMENARLITETREALDQQTATAEVLGVINSSPGDLAPVFDSMLEKATRLCDAAFGSLLTYDGEHFENVALQNVPDAFAEFAKPGRAIAFGPGTGPYRLVAGELFVHVIDGQAEAAYREGDPAQRALIDLAGARTWVTVPLRKDDELLGAITVFRQEVKPFTDKQIALLQNFAAQAVIAMENARLLGELRQRTDEVAELNRGLEARVAEQLDELGRVGRLKRFLAPQLAEMIVSQGDERILESHRREIVVVFCDLRGFTAFAETAEPEEVLDLLREYHAALGPLVSRFEGTLDHFSGDGIMVFFNDPVPCPDPAERAVRMAIAMRAAAGGFIATWRKRGRELGFGVGIAQGYATLGQIGFADRSDYTAIGTVCNLAARLCDEAKDGQILLARRVAAAVEETFALQEIGNLALKGLTQPVSVFNVIDERPADPSAKIVPLPQRAQQPG